MKSKIKQTSAIFLLVAMVCTLLCGCAPNTPDPRETMMTFQTAFNSFDLEGMLNCIDSQWADQVNALLSYTVGENGIAVGTFTQGLKSMMPFLSIISGGSLRVEDLPKIDLTILKANVDGNTAAVMCSGIFSCGDLSEPFAATVEMKLENGNWVICGIG